MPLTSDTHEAGSATDHAARVRGALDRALRSIPFYAKQGLAERLDEHASIEEQLARLPLLTRERIRPTLPKVWFPEGRDARTELASGAVSIIETGSAESRVRVLFDARGSRAQERRALMLNPHARRALEGSDLREAVLWAPERGIGSCGSGDPAYEERLEDGRLHLNSRQDPTFWTEPVMDRMLDELARHETSALLADPFYVDVLARYATRKGRALAVSGFVATTRARATLAHRRAIAAVNEGPTVNVFGAREVGPLFVQGEDERMHHASFATHVELLRARVETPGAEEVALVVVTTLDRDVQPFVRYVLGDLVRIAPNAPRDGAVPAILSVEGTLDDAVVRPDGALVTPGAVDRAIDSIDPLAYQLVQTDERSVEVEIVGGSPSDAAAALAPLLDGMKVTARSVTAVGVEPNGKYRTTRRKVGLSLSATFHGCEGV